jgi:hypothetical protein
MFNVTRGEPPISLANQTSYSSTDVIEALVIIFHNKCYICETKEPLSLNVEHFVSHQGDPVKMYDWNNLFYSCARCNNLKRHWFDGLIDCSNPTIDALRLIRHAPPATPFCPIVIEPKDDDPRTLETARLINKVFNEDDTGNKKVTSAALRKRVYKRYAVLIEHMNTYINEDSLNAEKDVALARIRHLMSKTQEYSAFLRWPILESPDLLNLVGDAID